MTEIRASRRCDRPRHGSETRGGGPLRSTGQPAGFARSLPAGWQGVAKGANPAGHEEDVPGWSWAADLLPQLESTDVHSRIDFTRRVYDAASPAVNQAVRETSILAFRCPSDVPGPTETANGLCLIGADDGEHHHAEDEEGGVAHAVDGGDLAGLCNAAKTNSVAAFPLRRLPPGGLPGAVPRRAARPPRVDAFGGIEGVRPVVCPRVSRSFPSGAGQRPPVRWRRFFRPGYAGPIRAVSPATHFGQSLVPGIHP